MALTAPQISQVRYTTNNPIPNFGDAFGALLNSGVTGYFARKEAAKDLKNKALLSAFPQFASTKQLAKVQGPGMLGTGMGWTQPPVDLSDTHMSLQNQRLRYDMRMDQPNDALLREEAVDLITKRKYSDPLGWSILVKQAKAKGVPEDQFIESEIQMIINAKKGIVSEVPAAAPIDFSKKSSSKVIPVGKWDMRRLSGTFGIGPDYAYTGEAPSKYKYSYNYKGQTYYSNDNKDWYDKDGKFFGSK
jgi:hypothetical protein